MARTKQTARAALVRAAPKIQTRGVGGSFKKSNKRRAKGGMRSRSPSPNRSVYSLASLDDSVDLNTQQFSIKFDNQAESQRISLQYRVIECKNCQALLNSHSKIKETINLTNVNDQIVSNRRSSRINQIDDAKKQEFQQRKQREWICQFCFTSNSVPQDYVQSTVQNPCYLIEDASVSIENQQILSQQTTIIYCIDVSGSMDTVVEKKSRLESVQEAITDQIKRMKFQKEKVKIGIITFGSYVTLYGKQQSNVPQKLYNDFDQITKHCQKVKDIAFSIDKDFNHIKDTIKGLNTYGSTALGPGVVAAIELASKGRKGAKIVLCTDGQANVGLQTPAFYSRAAQYAKQKGVMISILTLKGDHCNLKQLGKLSISTGGYVMKIDPKLLGTQFNKISKQVILGMQSQLTIKVSHLIEIENAVESQLSVNKTTLTKDYGNFTAETELTFSFKMLSKQQAKVKGVNLQLFNQARAPMQIQLKYLSPSGKKYLQVITDYRQLTENQSDLLKDMNFGLFSATALQKVSKFIKDELFQQANDQIRRYRSIVRELFSKTEKKQVINKFAERIQKLQYILQSKKNKKSGLKAVKAPPGMRPKASARKSVPLKNTQRKQLIGSKSRNKNRSRSRSRDNRKKNKKDSESSQSDSDLSNMAYSSDGEEQVLLRQMRARSNSVDSR